DVLRVSVHEVGQPVGFEHDCGYGIMAEALPLGVRRMPDPVENASTATSTTADDAAIMASMALLAGETAESPPSLTAVADVSPAAELAHRQGGEAGTLSPALSAPVGGIPPARLGRGFAASGNLFAALPEVVADQVT